MLSNETTETNKTPTNVKINDFAKATLLGIVLAGLLFVVAERTPAVKIHITNLVNNLKHSICDTSTLLECEVIQESQKRRLRYALTRTTNLQDAVELISWETGSEQSAVTFLALVRALQSEHWPNKSSNPTWAISRDALANSWALYPKLTTASQCYFCSNHGSNMFEWFTGSNQHNDYLRDLIEFTPRLFELFKSQETDNNIKHKMAIRQSMLANHGNRFGYLGKILYDKQDWDTLKILVANTNSAAPILDLDWNKIPSDIVHLSWQQGIRAADDLPIFTQKLMQSGYRPALRWALWMVAEGNADKDLRRMRKYTNTYLALILNNTNFGDDPEGNVVEYYNKHWRQIEFDEPSKQWMKR